MSADKKARGRVAEAVAQLEDAVAAKKCWTCGCLNDSVAAIERAYPTEQRPPEVAAVLRAAHERLQPAQYDCLGCAVCFPAIAVNLLNSVPGAPTVDLAQCLTKGTEPREGWPPYPGRYTVLRWRAPVAVCTLTDRPLADEVARRAGRETAIVGTLDTENLGIERIVQNVVANPSLRFLIVCGEDSRQAVGHLPGQSLLALAREGIDAQGRIVGARGRRPVLPNLSRDAVEHFRRTVEVIDRVGTTDVALVLDTVRTCSARAVPPAAAFAAARVVAPVPARAPERMSPDPAGYFVVFVDRARRLLSLEHYRTDGVLDAVVEGPGASEVAATAVERALLTRLDHAAYLGRELARAERALAGGEDYVQDAAPERRATALPLASSCGCGPADGTCGANA